MNGVDEQAVDWFIRVRSAKGDADVHAAWLSWIEADPAHRAAFAQIQEAWNVVGQIEAPPWPAPQELLLESGKAASGRTSLLRYAGLGLAASLLAGIALWFWRGDTNSQRITTGRGEQRSATLSDGSRVELGGATGVELDFTPGRRLVRADEGEAFYQVEHDPHRPFVVQSGPVTVTAIGTAFSVRREGNTVSVVVTEGVVDVKASSGAAAKANVYAKAGQRVRFEQGQWLSMAEPIRAETASAWRRGQLRFEEEPLRVVVSSLNRYAAKEIVLADAELRELKFTGIVFDDSTQDWLRAVERVFPVRLDESHSDRVVIHLRR